MRKPKFIITILFIGFLCVSFNGYAQPAWTFDLFGKEKKPEKYEEKLLPSEKTATKKFGLVRRFLQNTTSHYNFYFNANNRLNAVIERAKISNKDDYSKLLAFYPYTLENTASQKIELDSVIYKSTSGILLHDLRSEWVDNFYLLIAKSYYLRKDFDSAALTLQFINYNLFPRKKKEDDDKIVGTNTSSSGTGTVSIADKEKRSVAQKLFTRPASRNEALIWQVKTFIQQNELGDAAGMISILQNDANLPPRLQNDLHEVTSFWFYAQNMYDSAAIHLEKGLTNADTKEDKSRWQFLLAQLYENTGKYDKATEYYAKASKSTADVIMDIYAKLNSAKMMRGTDDVKELDKSIASLLSMAKKDKYESFRDIIYYSAAQLTLQRKDTAKGIALYLKSIKNNSNGSTYKDKSFMQLANIAYNQQQYKDARSYYDSVTVFVSENNIDSATIANRKEILARLIPFLNNAEKEDSIQRIAALPELERELLVKKLVKKYKKENGITEEDFGDDSPITFTAKNTEPQDLFKNSGINNGQWYFYNGSQRSKGFNEFKSKWGKRINVDNWRRKSSVQLATSIRGTGGVGLANNLDPDAPLTKEEKLESEKVIVDYSFEGLMGGLPLTKEKLDTSNFIWAKNLYNAAQIFQSELQDYNQAINKYNELVNKFPDDKIVPDAYVGLSFCYAKLGMTAKSDLYKNIIKTNFANSNAAKIINNPTVVKPNQQNPAATQTYETIYGMFLEGKFDEALTEKKKADSSFGKNYWSPQLLYIESVFYIKERKDSLAINTLKNIETLYPTSSLKPKATTLIEVLGRRAAIEKYLTELQVTRATDDKIIVADDKPVAIAAPKAIVAKPLDTKVVAPVIIKKPLSDSIKTPPVYVNKSFTLQPDKPHYVAMILDKVAAVYVNEAKNALERFNKESMATVNIAIKKDTLNAEKSLLLFSSFENADVAMKYFDKIKKVAPTELSWLQAAKYSFIIISDNNLQLLQANKDLIGYKQLLNANFPNKF
jgi:outer membrane protein assembly factor BamD (BamD/ComL family)